VQTFQRTTSLFYHAEDVLVVALTLSSVGLISQCSNWCSLRYFGIFRKATRPSSRAPLSHLTFLAMSDFEIAIGENMGDETPADIETIGEEVIQIETGANATNGENGAALQDDEEDGVIPTRVTFIDHLKSPIVELLIGEGEGQTLTAHQALLVQSPFFDDACSQFSDNAVVRLFNP
jgi:hypothetical protein